MTIEPRPLSPERRAEIVVLLERLDDTVVGRWNADDKARVHMGATDLLAALLHAEIERDGWRTRALAAERRPQIRCPLCTDKHDPETDCAE